MTAHWQARFGKLGVAIPLALWGVTVVFGESCLAQIIPDNTLSSEKSVVTPISPTVERIDGGAVRGSSIFHSFQEFNIGAGKAAYFANPATIENIFSRVTGSNPSQLFGTLGVLGNANLFFINPNGILFGANAKLDIRGSFVASTASSLILPDGTLFSATNPQAPPLLKINVQAPIGLEFEGEQLGSIVNAGNLGVGQDLKLAAGNLDLQGQLHAGGDLTLQATDTLKIRDSNDNPFIAAAGSQLLIQGNQKVDIFALNNSNSGLFSSGDMVLRSGNQVGGDAHFTAGGNFRIEKLDGSLGDLFSPYDPIIFAAGDVSLGDYFGASLHILAGGRVSLGNVDIFFADSADNTINPDNNTLFNRSDTVAALANVTLSDGTELTINGSSKPTLDVRAGIDWSTFEGGVPGNINTGFVSPSFNDTATSADINVGNINIFLPFSDGGRVFLSNQYRPNPSLSGNITINGAINTRDFADGGAVTIDSRNHIFLADNLDTSSFRNLGRGGDVTLLAREDISVNPGVSISSEGALGGNITLNSGGNISFASSFIRNRSFNETPVEPTPTGGNINITANSLSLNEFSRLDASTERFANAGNVNIDVTNTFKLDFSDILSRVNSAGVGNAGNININAGFVEVVDGSNLQTRILGQGNAGNINIVAKDGVIFAGIRDGFRPIATTEVRNHNDAEGNAGNINISVTNGSLEVRDDTRLITSSFGRGNVGKVKIDAQDSIIFDGSSIFATVESGVIGNGSEIEITANSLNFTNSQLTADTAGQGNAGNINLNGGAIALQDTEIFTSARVRATGNAGKVTINASDRLSLNNSNIFSTVGVNAMGKGGDIQITSPLLSLTNNSAISTTTDGMGDAGNVNIVVGDDFTLENSKIFTRVTQREGNQLTVNAGDVNINAGSISFRDGSRINASATAGNAGKVNLQADGAISLENDSAILTSVLQGNGVGGDIFIDAQSLSLVDNSTLGSEQGTETTGGSAGNIRVQTEEFVHLHNSGTISASSFKGFGGNILIDTKKLSLDNGSQIRAVVFGNQPAGSLTVNASESVEVSGFANSLESGLFIDTLGNGDAGTLKINTGRLIVKDGGRVSTSSSFNSPRSLPFLPTRGTGKGGNLEVNASEFVQVIGTTPDAFTLSSLTSIGGDGDGGKIQITTPNLIVKDGAEISALTLGKGKGGTITIDSQGMFLSNQARITARTFREGEAGRIILKGNILETTAGSQITTSTSGSRKAGDIILTIKDNITLDGADTGIFANTTPNSTGNGGEINIDPATFIIKNGAAIAVNSQGKGIGGDIKVQAGILNLNNGFIDAKTRSNTGGNITLDVDKLILLRNGSQISTTAGDEQFGGNGGNITIDTAKGFIVASPYENNDITANAFTGNGGRVDITTQGIFGLEFRDFQTEPFNDITASSDFGLEGDVNINFTIDADPTSGLTNLPEEPVNPEISDSCQVSSGEEAVKFFDIGKGGSPQRPEEPFSADLDEWIDLEVTNTSESAKAPNTTLSNEDTFATTEASTVSGQLTPPCQVR